MTGMERPRRFAVSSCCCARLLQRSESWWRGWKLPRTAPTPLFGWSSRWSIYQSRRVCFCHSQPPCTLKLGRRRRPLEMTWGGALPMPFPGLSAAARAILRETPFLLGASQWFPAHQCPLARCRLPKPPCIYPSLNHPYQPTENVDRLRRFPSLPTVAAHWRSCNKPEPLKGPTLSRPTSRSWPWEVHGMWAGV